MKTIISYITLAIVLLGNSYGQSFTLKGIVTNEQGNPVKDVLVSTKNLKTKTLTNPEGFYSIEVHETEKSLLFIHENYITQEVQIGSRSRIDVQLQPKPLVHEESSVKNHELHRAVADSEASLFKKGMYTASSPSGSMAFDAYIRPFNTEGYSTIHEQGYKSVLQEPLSTFSIDVDKASWANVRRFINMGQLPPKDAVRIEEMVNYFSYSYEEPEDEHPFSVSTELSLCPWQDKHQLLRIGLKAKEMSREEVPASNLVFLIDVSGSMNAANKLPLLKSSFELLVKQLRAKDRVAIVVYAGAAGVVLESTPGNEKAKIVNALNRLNAGGSTAGGEGLKLAYKIASQQFIENGNNRIILATDGDFNIGPSSNAEMERLIEVEREKGIFMTVLGFGMGNYKDDKMEIIADKGNGNYAYIDNIKEARKFVVSEFAGTLYTLAKDVKFQIEFNPQRVKAYRLIGYENRLLNKEDFNDDKKDAGELGAGHTVTALYEIIPAGSDEDVASVDPLRYQDDNSEKKVIANPHAELMTIKLRYKKPDGQKSILAEEAIQGRVLDTSKVSDDFRFASAVAGFGLYLRDSEFKGDISTAKIISLAEKSKGDDPEGIRSEFIQLVKTVSDLADAPSDKQN